MRICKPSDRNHQNWNDAKGLRDRKPHLLPCAQMSMDNTTHCRHSIHVLTLLACVPATRCVSAFILSVVQCCWREGLCAMFLHLTSMCACCPATLLCLFSSSQFLHHAWGKACVDLVIFMYLHDLPAFLQPFVSRLLF